MKGGHFPGRLRGPMHMLERRKLWILLVVGVLVGYLLGMVIMETADVMFTTELKHHQDPNSPSSSQQGGRALAESGSGVAKAVTKSAGDTIHSLLTSNGSPYQNFQSRIMYSTYKLVQKMPGGEKMTAFTRILHRMTDDALMEEMPTYRVQPLHPACDTWCEFPVADRPNAVQQWVDAAVKDPSMVKGAWVLLLEADYVWMKPFQAPDAYSGAPGVQFHYDYIQPEFPGVPAILERLARASGMELKTKVPPSGPAPALLRFDELRRANPMWEKVTAAIEADKEAVQKLGWVREMYAWDLALAANGIQMVTEEPGNLFVQPPHDQRVGGASMCHYTWAAIYKDANGNKVWQFEKREYTAAELALKVPRLPMPPQPFQPNTWKLQDGNPVTQQLHETMTAMLQQMNAGIDTLPDLTAKVAGFATARRQSRRALK